MVSSEINPKIKYIEVKTIDAEDAGHTSSIYEIELFDILVAVVLGKPKYTFSQHDVVYYPVYVISKNKIKSQIGVFELESNKVLNALDGDGDLEIYKLGEPLLYSFVNKNYINKSNSDPNIYYNDYNANFKKVVETEITKIQTEKERNDAESEKGEIAENDEDEVFKLKVSNEKVSKEKEKIETTLEKGVFTVDKNFEKPALLTEETESEKPEFHKNAKNTWIENFMRNNNYKITEVESNGDCFFAVIREAFKTIGYTTSVAKLRALVAHEASDEIYREHRTLYFQLETERKIIEDDIKLIKKTNLEYQKRMKKVTELEESKKLEAEVNKLKEDYKKKKKELAESNENIESHVGFIKNIDTFEKYQQYIQTSSFWADAWSVSVIEKALNIKLMIFSEKSYKENSLDSVFNCGIINNDIENNGTFNPDFYIMTTYSGDHYRLITYKNKSIFTFTEIPFNVKNLVVNKCLERNSGLYYLIQDFRNYKSNLGLDANEGKPENEIEEEIQTNHSDLYDLDAELSFYENAQTDTNPGKGLRETVAKNKIVDFIQLAKIPEWRRKLSDKWVGTQMTVDNHKWATVAHYTLASRFKKGHPDFYLQFALDNGETELSKDPKLALKVVEDKPKKYFPKGVKQDVDYALGRDEEERLTALRAKFFQNEDLKQLLLLTNRAKLSMFRRGEPEFTDISLMRIRKELMDTMHKP